MSYGLDPAGTATYGRRETGQDAEGLGGCDIGRAWCGQCRSAGLIGYWPRRPRRGEGLLVAAVNAPLFGHGNPFALMLPNERPFKLCEGSDHRE